VPIRGNQHIGPFIPRNRYPYIAPAADGMLAWSPMNSGHCSPGDRCETAAHFGAPGRLCHHRTAARLWLARGHGRCIRPAGQQSGAAVRTGLLVSIRRCPSSRTPGVHRRSDRIPGSRQIRRDWFSGRGDVAGQPGVPRADCHSFSGGQDRTATPIRNGPSTWLAWSV
jgi:hypothetical protein